MRGPVNNWNIWESYLCLRTDTGRLSSKPECSKMIIEKVMMRRPRRRFALLLPFGSEIRLPDNMNP
jgi:hypothetical protein